MDMYINFIQEFYMVLQVVATRFQSEAQLIRACFFDRVRNFSHGLHSPPVILFRIYEKCAQKSALCQFSLRNMQRMQPKNPIPK